MIIKKGNKGKRIKKENNDFNEGKIKCRIKTKISLKV